MPRNVNPGEIRSGSGMANQDSVDSNSFVQQANPNTGLNGHIEGGSAHEASAITTTTTFGLYDYENVQGNLDELAALIPPRPPTIGNFSTLVSFSGIPDWGHLKLADAGHIARGNITPPGSSDFDSSVLNTDGIVYPYYWTVNEVASSTTPFTIPGNDPATDSVFNIDPAATPDPTYTGGGPGETHQGGFIRTDAIIESVRLMPSTGGGFRPIVVSASVYPADRGTIALFLWPPGGDVAAFLAQPLEDRVVAALNCGQGITGDCDGAPGGAFEEGNIFDFPGRASGQLDLVEIHIGLNNQTGAPLPAGPQPSAGQVRLGTDPQAGPVIPGGIPILGGTTAATGGGNDNNFFRYRLPYLADYSTATGLQFTPDIEKPRYFEKPPVSLDFATDLTQAGNFGNFEKNYWQFQVGRIRHRFEFIQNTPPPPDATDQGQYIMIHFRREADFEAFARDGIMPDDLVFGYEIYSASQLDYINPESTDNLANPTTPFPTSEAYHTLRAAILEDFNTLPTASTASFDFDRTIDEVMFCSGVQYFVPGDVGSKWSITVLDLTVDDLWNNSFLLGNGATPAEITEGLDHRNPLFAYVGGFTAETNAVSPAVPAFNGTVLTQRIEFRYDELDSVGGPWDLTSGPTPADVATLQITLADPPLTFNGDDNICHFWTDARLRAFGQTPVGHQEVANTSQEFLFPNPGAGPIQILFHTTGHSPTQSPPGALYGNFLTGGIPSPARPQLESAFKDANEIFLDEVYRLIANEITNLDPTFMGGVGNLFGPGLPYPPAKIEIPVRYATKAVLDGGFASYIQQGYNLLDLSSNVNVIREAQVAGLPDRNPPLSEGVSNPCPQTGILLYPKDDYTTGVRPSLADGDISTPQFDYSISLNDRFYFRVFDAAQTQSATPFPEVVGQPFITLYVLGLQLSNFEYRNNPVGGLGNEDMSIAIKVPGLTTWMDLGRRDGDGPSKQDPLVDGAGCQMVDPDLTKDFVHPRFGIVGCTVRVNVGPAANFFINTGPLDTNYAPLFLRVQLKDLSGLGYFGSRDLDFTQGGVNGDAINVRGLVTIGIVPPGGLETLF